MTTVAQSNPALQAEQHFLTPDESTQLNAHEVVIARGFETFYEVGMAFRAIRESRLYRQYGTFEDYCRQRWELDRVYAYRVMSAAEVVENLLPIGNKPANEAQARPLTELEPEAQRIVWEVVQQTAPGGKVTAAHVKSVATVFKEVVVTNAIDDGSGVQIAVPDVVKAAVTEETYERMKRQEAHIQEKQNRGLFTSDSPEWFTPPDIIALVRSVLGTIELDPASSTEANKLVGATCYCTSALNGLSQRWDASTLYLNPPYGDEIDQWVKRLVDEYEAGCVREAIALVPARTDTAWFRRLRDYPRCFINGRIKFVSPQGTENSAPFPSAAVYLGSDTARFAQVFRALGDVFVLYQD